MSTTYLTIVNHVLRRMRENEVSNVSTNNYSKMCVRPPTKNPTNVRLILLIKINSSD